MQLAAVVDALERIAPLEFAEPWDNVGLLLGDPAQPVNGVLLTIDYTADVAAEAIEKHCDLVIAYHPPLFKPINRFVAGESSGLLLEAARRGVAIYSPHTAWDAVPGGANDFLADVLMMRDARPLRPAAGGASDKADQFKLVVFVPTDAVDHVADAMFAAGAGGTEGTGGDNTRCSLRAFGIGTFMPGENAKPAIGVAGRDERVAEERLEMLVPARQLDRAIAVLRLAHPYEEPAFDIFPIIAPPAAGFGAGRVGKLPGDLTADMLLNHIQRELDLPHLLAAGPVDRMVKTVACCAGAGGELLDDAIAAGADFYLTGEVRHHDALRAAKLGMVVACTLHTNSERGSLTRLQHRLSEAIPGLPVLVSQLDRDPFSFR